MLASGSTVGSLSPDTVAARRSLRRALLGGVAPDQAALGMTSPFGPRINEVSTTLENPNVARIAAEEEIAQKRALAKALRDQSAGTQRIEHPLQGVNQIAQAVMGGLTERQAASAEEQRRKAVAEALSGAIGSDTGALGMSEEQLRTIIALNPEVGQQLLATVLQQRMAPPPEPKPPTIQEFWDEATGRRVKKQWNPTTGGWDVIGGVEAAPSGDAVDPQLKEIQDPNGPPGRTVLAWVWPDGREPVIAGEAPAKDDARDPAIENRVRILMESGVPELIAKGIAGGRYEVSVNPVSGERVIIDKGQSPPVVMQTVDERMAQALFNAGIGGADAAPQQPVEDGNQPQQQGQNIDLYGSADQVTGIVPGLQELATDIMPQATDLLPQGVTEGLQNLPLVGNLFQSFPETVEGRQELAAAQNDLIRSLSINPRFPVGEINRIRQEIDISPSMLRSPDSMRARMQGVDTYLRARQANELRAANDPTIPADQRQNAIQAARDIDNFLRLLNVPQASRAPTIEATDALNQAREAIAQGADPEAVRRRLQENGIDPGAL